MKKKIIYMLLGICTTCITSCDKIDENERLVSTVYQAQRSILIEDYTGQKCVNCPMATNTLHSLSEYFGDSIVSVAIHGGPFGVAEPRGLATKEAEVYYTALNIKSQPIGVINHRGITTNYANWTSEVMSLIKTPTNVTMSVSSKIEGNELQASINSSATTNITALLKVWLTEDNIVAQQSLPEAWGGGTDKNYVHSHVYRKTVSNIDGVVVELSPVTTTNDFTCPLASTYKKENLCIVAFVYTEADGVLQVIHRKVEY